MLTEDYSHYNVVNTLFWHFFFRPDTYLYHNIYSQCEHLLHTGLDNIFAVVLGHKWASRPLLHWHFPDPDIARAEVSTDELWFSCLNFFFFKPLWIHHTTAAPFIKRISCKWRLRGIFRTFLYCTIMRKKGVRLLLYCSYIQNLERWTLKFFFYYLAHFNS